MTPDAVRLVDAIYVALLELDVPDTEVRVERLLSTFALGYAASEMNGRFSAETLNRASDAHLSSRPRCRRTGDSPPC
ncbi:MAG TPA: hypothetical protein VFY84_04195 [Jiangellales bacterium]|nr:hypothetical protein [Jiangellales bacterium]